MNWKRWDNIGAMGLGILGLVGYLSWQVATDRYETMKLKAAPVDDWFSVRSVTIPDFVEGDDPMIQYDRQVHQEFSGTWNVEIHEVGGISDYALCSGSGTNLYQPKEELPKAGVKLSWFIGKDCKLPRGQYIAQMNWEVRPIGVPTKALSITSNNFHVAPKV